MLRSLLGKTPKIMCIADPENGKLMYADINSHFHPEIAMAMPQLELPERP